MSKLHPYILDRRKTVLVVIDMQEPFLRLIHERDRVIDRVRLLVQAAQILRIPTLTSVQYAERMGPTIHEIAELLPGGAEPVCNKMSFSCGRSNDFLDALAAADRRQVLICGVETHVCVSQTALDLLHEGYNVHIAADAVSARTPECHKLGMEKMRDSGVVPCSAEAAVFELVADSSIPEFKQIHTLVK
jgi:nicotinamidase-related amidase